MARPLYACAMPNSSFLRGRSAVLTAAALASVAAPAAAAWTEPVPGESPLNVAPTRSATDAAVASVGGVPYVAWREEDGSNNEVRVARLVTTGWERVGATAVPESPVNNDSLGDARSVSLADVNGVPYVAWAEFDGTNTEVRVARPTADGTGWERVGQAVNAASPVNVSPSRNAVRPTIANVNGAPWVTWTEDDGTNAEVRVARLRPDGLGWERVGEGVRPGSPINRDPKRSAFDATLAVASGVPYVAWAEGDGTNTEIRVARPNAAGTGWVPVGQTLKPASPVNANAKGRARGPALADWGGRLAVAWVEQAPGAVRRVHASVLSTSGAGWEPLDQGKGLNANRARPATAPRIAVVGGGLWATWAEFDGQNREVRVARLATAGGRWEQVPAGVSPVNASAGRNADAPAIADVTNVPYVAWVEADAVNREMRASRLQPDFTRLSASGTEERVAMTATMRTYGLPYQVGFQISGGGLARATRPGTVSGDPATTKMPLALRTSSPPANSSRFQKGALVFDDQHQYDSGGPLWYPRYMIALDGSPVQAGPPPDPVDTPTEDTPSAVLPVPPWEQGPPTTLVLLFAGPMLILLMVFIGRRTRDLTERRHEELNWMSAYFLDMLRGLPTLKLFGREAAETEGVGQASTRSVVLASMLLIATNVLLVRLIFFFYPQ